MANQVTYSYLLAKIMRQEGYSIRRLAEEAQVDRAGLRRFRAGLAMPSWPVACRIADALGVKLSDFVGRKRRRVASGSDQADAQQEGTKREESEEELVGER